MPLKEAANGMATLTCVFNLKISLLVYEYDLNHFVSFYCGITDHGPGGIEG